MGANIQEGFIFEYPFTFDQKDVNEFAEISGDFNPIHIDEEYAEKSIFKRRIVHGFLAGSVFSKVLGTEYPGYGTIYLKQSMAFYKPIFTGEKYIAKFEVAEVFKNKNRARIITKILDSKNREIISGEALVQHDKIK